MTNDDNPLAEGTDDGVSRRTFLNPAEVDPGSGWVAISGTSDTNVVAGVET